jgi:hypothetical protein
MGQKFLSLVYHPDRFWDPPILLSSRFQGFLPDIKWFVHEVDTSPPSTAKFKNAWGCVFTPLYISALSGAKLTTKATRIYLQVWNKNK